MPAASKTDNFKVNTASTTFCLTVQKLFLQSDGVTFVPQPAWEFDVTDPLPVNNKFFTDTTGQVVLCDLAPGAYMVAEDASSSVVGITFEYQRQHRPSCSDRSYIQLGYRTARAWVGVQKPVGRHTSVKACLLNRGAGLSRPAHLNPRCYH